jgi:hypothetical protein
VDNWRGPLEDKEGIVTPELGIISREDPRAPPREGASVNWRQVLITLAAVAALIPTGRLQAQTASLKDVYAKDFVIGVALGGTMPRDYSGVELSAIRSQFNSVTPANCMYVI